MPDPVDPQPTPTGPPPGWREGNRRRRRRRAAAAAAAAATVLVVAGVGWVLLNAPPRPGVGAASPSVPPTQSAVAATPTASPTQQPTPSPTAAPTASPTAPPTTQPTPTPASGPADGTYYGDGLFKSFDGSVSYQTAWRLFRAGETAEVAQLRSPRGEPSQTAQGIIDPQGRLVAVSDDPGYCEVLILESLLDEWIDELFVAYGPPGMTCPDALTVSERIELLHDLLEFEAALRDAFDWGDDVETGSVQTGGWTGE